MALKTEARRQKILEAALCEFEARGYAAARMEDIARAPDFLGLKHTLSY